MRNRGHILRALSRRAILTGLLAAGLFLAKDVCGFDGTSTGFGFACETGFAMGDRDRGQIAEEGFKDTYWNVRPDVRLWAKNGAQQLIIELKGGGPNETRHAAQMRKYFSYLRDRQASGAVIYLVPEYSDAWLELLGKFAADDRVRFGVIQWGDEFLQPMYPQLIEIISESLVSTADLLKKALALRPR